MILPKKSNKAPSDHKSLDNTHTQHGNSLDEKPALNSSLAHKEAIDVITDEEDDILELNNPIEPQQEQSINNQSSKTASASNTSDLPSPQSTPEAVWQQSPAHETSKEDDWWLVGASILGNMHRRKNIVCQDRYYIKNGKKGGVAVVCDGAGSKKNSDKGAALTSSFVGEYLYEKIKDNEIARLSQNDLGELKNEVFEHVRSKLEDLAKEESIPFESLGSTLIAVIYTQDRLICLHIGDGRAAYQDTKGQWHPLIEPWNTKEGYTIFTTTNDVYESPLPRDEYLRATLIDESVAAFAIMSDGCEKASFECLVQNEETKKYQRKNTPFDRFFNPVKKTLVGLHEQDDGKVGEIWAKFLTDGMPVFIKEDDDKTMIFSINKSHKDI